MEPGAGHAVAAASARHDERPATPDGPDGEPERAERMPAVVTAVHPSIAHSTEAMAEPKAPPMKLHVTKAVSMRLRSSREIANARA